MKNNELRAIAAQPDNEINCCPILEQRDGYIRFVVDSGLSLPSKHLKTDKPDDIIDIILKTEQIDSPLRNIFASSLEHSKISQIGADVMWKTFITCFAEHRPLVLSPDMIWLLISQTLAGHIRRNAEKLRSKIVDFGGQMDLCIKTTESLGSETLDWASLFSQFYDQINKEGNKDVTSVFINDFSTTGPSEKLASVATLMGAVESYFRYHEFACICGIPHITLLGTTADWRKVLAKTNILSKIGLDSWQKWLEPILKEFIRTSEGKPNTRFWKSIVMDTRPGMFETRRGCIPSDMVINGWCIALFPFNEGEEQSLDEQYVDALMDSEMLRVGFLHHEQKPNNVFDTTQMELWAGFVGVEEDEKSYALTPTIGWFVRKSDQDKESLARLKGQDDNMGINLRIKEVPSLLSNFHHIHYLTLNFIEEINIPEWMDNIEIDSFTVYGKATPAQITELQGRFNDIAINPKEDDEE